MDDEKIPSFSSPSDEIKFWKDKYFQKKKDMHDLQEEFDEYQSSHRELERQLEKNLEKVEKDFKDLKSRYDRLKTEFDDQTEKTRKNIGDTSKTISELQDKITQLDKMNTELRKEKRNLEIENDNLERKERELTASFQDLSDKLNKLLEEHAWATTELEEQKMITKETEQRLKDEMRELQTDLVVVNRSNNSKETEVPPSQPSVKETNGVSGGSTSIDLADELLAIVKEMDKRLSSMPKLVIKRTLSATITT